MCVRTFDHSLPTMCRRTPSVQCLAISEQELSEERSSWESELLMLMSLTVVHRLTIRASSDADAWQLWTAGFDILGEVNAPEPNDDESGAVLIAIPVEREVVRPADRLVDTCRCHQTSQEQISEGWPHNVHDLHVVISGDVFSWVAAHDSLCALLANQQVSSRMKNRVVPGYYRPDSRTSASL
jgi:hypothetical protein